MEVAPHISRISAKPRVNKQMKTLDFKTIKEVNRMHESMICSIDSAKKRNSFTSHLAFRSKRLKNTGALKAKQGRAPQISSVGSQVSDSVMARGHNASYLARRVMSPEISSVKSSAQASRIANFGLSKPVTPTLADKSRIMK